jgi:hypothetical protein
VEVLEKGEEAQARGERRAKEMVFAHGKLWAGRHYNHKKVKLVYMVVEEGEIVVVTVLAYYGRWN